MDVLEESRVLVPVAATDEELADLFTLLAPYDDSDATKDTRTHIVNPPKNIHIWKPGMTAQDVVDIARANGWEVVALCDYRWVPKRNPDKYDACEDCMRIAGEIMRSKGE